MYRQRDGGEREYEGSWLTNQDCLTCRPLETTFLTLAIAWDALKGIVWACWSGFVSGTYPYSEYHSHCRVWRSTGAKQCGRRTGVTQREALFDWKPRCLKQSLLAVLAVLTVLTVQTAAKVPAVVTLLICCDFVTCTVTYKHHKANEILYIHQAQKHARNIKVKLFLFSCLKLLHTWKAVSGGVWHFVFILERSPGVKSPRSRWWADLLRRGVVAWSRFDRRAQRLNSPCSDHLEFQ